MPRPRNQVPTYRLHKQSGQAIVTISNGGTRRDVLLGKYGTPESRTEYQRVLAELNTSGPAAAVIRATGTNITVNELLLAFIQWAETHYRTLQGEPTTEIGEMIWSVAPLKELFGDALAREFGPRSLATVRQRMIERGWCRSLINRRIDRVKRVFKWATAEELVPVHVYQALRTLAGLRKGRTEARESDPVKPVDLAHVGAVLPFLNRHLRCMVELQRFTGMRPNEVCRLTLGEVDRSGEVWLYRPSQHKTAHHGKDRVIPLGPRARAALVAFLAGGHPPPEGFSNIDPADNNARLVAADAYQEAGRETDATLLRDPTRSVAFVSGCVVDPRVPLFSPYEAREERFKAMRAARVSKVTPSQANRRVRNPRRVPKGAYTPHAYAHAVEDACYKAGVPVWSPNRLRHTYATEVRRTWGLEAAQVLLGHACAKVTQMYAERDLALATRVANEIG
jgi:integrase